MEHPEQPSQKKKKPKIPKNVDITSSLNKYFMCNGCGKQYMHKASLVKHHIQCESEKNPQIVSCRWCNLEFKNRGNLVTHAYHLHGDSRMIQDAGPTDEELMGPPITNKVPKSYKATPKTTATFCCDVCHSKFLSQWQLKYHIRKQHFNLTARAPYCELKKVNQVWFEKVLNSNIVVEMKKTGENTLVMRKLDPNTAIKVNETYRKIIDLRSLYPTGRSSELVQCPVCYKAYVKRDFKKHMDEKHHKITKHRCNNCNKNFKRSYAFLKHVCNKARKVRGVRQFDNDIRISSVESLSIPL